MSRVKVSILALIDPDLLLDADTHPRCFPSTAAVQQQDPSWAQYYSQYYAGMAGQTAGQDAHSNGQTAAQGAASADAQPDYTQQWIEYYRNLGMHKEAEQVEAMAKAQKAASSSSGASAGHAQESSGNGSDAKPVAYPGYGSYSSAYGSGK